MSFMEENWVSIKSFKNGFFDFFDVFHPECKLKSPIRHGIMQETCRQFHRKQQLHWKSHPGCNPLYC